MWASRIGSEPICHVLLDKGADAKAKNYYGETTVTCAAQYGHEAVLKLLLARGACGNINDVIGENEFTALLLATQKGFHEIVEVLINGGAKMVKTTRNFRTSALMIGAALGHKSVVRVLLGKLPNQEHLDWCDADGNTALMLAAWNGEMECVRLLLAAKASTHLTNLSGLNAMGLARLRHHSSIVALLKPVSPTTPWYKRPLFPHPDPALRSTSPDVYDTHNPQSYRGLTPRLPPGWEKRLSAEGHEYYLDHIKKTTTRTRPPLILATSDITGPSSYPEFYINPQARLPPGWAKRFTLDGRGYYVDHITRATSWVAPPLLMRYFFQEPIH